MEEIVKEKELRMEEREQHFEAIMKERDQLLSALNQEVLRVRGLFNVRGTLEHVATLVRKLQNDLRNFGVKLPSLEKKSENWRQEINQLKSNQHHHIHSRPKRIANIYILFEAVSWLVPTGTCSIASGAGTRSSIKIKRCLLSKTEGKIN